MSFDRAIDIEFGRLLQAHRGTQKFGGVRTSFRLFFGKTCSKIVEANLNCRDEMFSTSPKSSNELFGSQRDANQLFIVARKDAFVRERRVRPDDIAAKAFTRWIDQMKSADFVVTLCRQMGQN